MKTVSDIITALHDMYPNDRYGLILIELMNYVKAYNLRSVSFEDALRFYEEKKDHET